MTGNAPWWRSAARRSGRAGAFAVLLAGLAAGPSHASPETLRRSFGNLFQAPLDVVLAPVTAGIATVRNFDEVGDHPAEAAVYAVPGYLGLTILQVGVGALRLVSGAVQLLPGLVLFPFEGVDLAGRFDYFSHGEALVEGANPLAEEPPWLVWVPIATPFTIDAKFGIISPFGLSDEPPPEGLEAVVVKDRPAPPPAEIIDPDEPDEDPGPLVPGPYVPELYVPEPYVPEP